MKYYSNAKRIDNTSLLDLCLKQVEHRPGLYLNPVSLTSLGNFIRGYSLAKPNDNFFGKHGFRYWYFDIKKQPDTSNWYDSILYTFEGNEVLALEYFFSLLQEYSIWFNSLTNCNSECPP